MLRLSDHALLFLSGALSMDSNTLQLERLVFSLLHRPEKCAILQQPSGVELRPIFDKQQIAIGKWQLAGAGTWLLVFSTW